MKTKLLLFLLFATSLLDTKAQWMPTDSLDIDINNQPNQNLIPDGSLSVLPTFITDCQLDVQTSSIVVEIQGTDNYEFSSQSAAYYYYREFGTGSYSLLGGMNGSATINFDLNGGTFTCTVGNLTFPDSNFPDSDSEYVIVFAPNDGINNDALYITEAEYLFIGRTPTAMPTADPSLACPGETVNLVGGADNTLVEDGDDYFIEHTWNPSGNLTNENSETPTFSSNNPDDYSYNYEVTNHYVPEGLECSSAQTPVSFTVNPTPTVTIENAPAAACASQSFTVNAGGDSGLDYQWSINGSPQGSNSDTFNVINPQAGSLTIGVEGTDGAGCSAQVDSIVLIRPTVNVALSFSNTEQELTKFLCNESQSTIDFFYNNINGALPTSINV